jgi:hypothetical protein
VVGCIVRLEVVPTMRNSYLLCIPFSQIRAEMKRHWLISHCHLSSIACDDSFCWMTNRPLRIIATVSSVQLYRVGICLEEDSLLNKCSKDRIG